MNPHFRNFECFDCAWFSIDSDSGRARRGVCRRVCFGATNRTENTIQIGVVSGNDAACPAFVDDTNTEFDETKQPEEIGADEQIS